MLAVITAIILVSMTGIVWSLCKIGSGLNELREISAHKIVVAPATPVATPALQVRVVVSVEPVPVNPVEVLFDTLSLGMGDVPREELLALSVVIYGEARGESAYGMAAVADTIRNRVKSRMFPNTYVGVVTQHKQFSCVRHPNNLILDISQDRLERRVFAKIVRLAYRTISGSMKRMTYDALYYHTTGVHPYWASHYERLGVVGHHIFYTASRR